MAHRWEMTGSVWLDELASSEGPGHIARQVQSCRRCSGIAHLPGASLRLSCDSAPICPDGCAS